MKEFTIGLIIFCCSVAAVYFLGVASGVIWRNRRVNSLRHELEQIENALIQSEDCREKAILAKASLSIEVDDLEASLSLYMKDNFMLRAQNSWLKEANKKLKAEIEREYYEDHLGLPKKPIEYPKLHWKHNPRHENFDNGYISYEGLDFYICEETVRATDEKAWLVQKYIIENIARGEWIMLYWDEKRQGYFHNEEIFSSLKAAKDAAQEMEEDAVDAKLRAKNNRDALDSFAQALNAGRFYWGRGGGKTALEEAIKAMIEKDRMMTEDKKVPATDIDHLVCSAKETEEGLKKLTDNMRKSIANVMAVAPAAFGIDSEALKSGPTYIYDYNSEENTRTYSNIALAEIYVLIGQIINWRSLEMSERVTIDDDFSKEIEYFMEEDPVKFATYSYQKPYVGTGVLYINMDQLESHINL